MLEKKLQVAGMNFVGGAHGQFFFCILEHYPEKDRWFLHTLDYDPKAGYSDLDAKKRLDENEFKHVVVDFPLDRPLCTTCSLPCPGEARCGDQEIQKTRKFINSILDEDRKRYEKDPKHYERERQLREEIDYSIHPLKKNSSDHVLSRSFKRRLRKGILPYWNRPLDAWVWANYYDPLMDFFSYSFDSFKDTSLMNLFHFEYLLKHLTGCTVFYETNTYLVLIELFRNGMFSKKTLNEFKNFESAVGARLNILESIEKKLDVFIYEKDFEILVRNPRAFKSFLLSLAARQIHLSQGRRPFENPDHSFIVPLF